MSQPRSTHPLPSQRRSAPVGARISVAMVAALLSITGWLRGEEPTDDRGSDASEKSFMVILAITLGLAVTAAAVAFVKTKTDLFK